MPTFFTYTERFCAKLQTQLTDIRKNVQLSEPRTGRSSLEPVCLPPNSRHSPPTTFGCALAFVGPIFQKKNNLLLAAVVS